MIVTIGNTKGGVGKTTLPEQVALARRLAGRDVLSGRPPTLACVQLADGRLPRAQLGPLPARRDDTLIDVDGRDSEAPLVALSRSDMVVVPVRPRAADVWALADIASLIEQALEARQEDGRAPMRVLVVLNLADPGDNPDTTDAAAALVEFPQLSAVGTQISRRKTVANAMAHGLAVAEMTPHDAKACAEIVALVSNVFDGQGIT
jgi:chromosome partitioning protein